MYIYAKHGDILMCLAQLLFGEDDPDYKKTFQRHSKDMFTLLDNGANEGRALSDNALAEASEELYTDEIVLPDVLGSHLETYEASVQYLKSHTQARDSIRYMGVVQGTSDSALYGLIHLYATQPRVQTLGLPRLLLGLMGKSVRIDLANWIDRNYPKRFQIHLLGASSIWPKEPYFANRYAPHIRSIDTSLPFNYGLQGQTIDKCQRPIDRPKDYFTRTYVVTERTSFMHNVNIYKEWCNGKG